MAETETNGPADAEPAGVRQRLSALRAALLNLHKALLEAERISYEASFGQISSPYQFLHLVTQDPWFAWLTPVTQLITAVDERLESPEPLATDEVEALVRKARELLVATTDGEGFSRHYDEALQRSPDVIMAHAVAARIIRAKG